MNGKLVRDNIPEIIIANGDVPKTRILTDDEYLAELDKKLLEEVGEYLEHNDLNELPDILEVVRAIARARGSSIEEAEQKRQEKFNKRGGFTKKIYLYKEAE